MKNQKLVEMYVDWFKHKYPFWAELGFTKAEALMIHYLGNIENQTEEVVNELKEISSALDSIDYKLECLLEHMNVSPIEFKDEEEDKESGG